MDTAKKTPKAPAAPKSKPAKATKEPKAKRAPQEQMNGVAIPREGTTSAAVWNVANKLSAKGAPAERHAVMEACAKEGINEATVATQYQRWRIAHDVPSRKPSVKVKKAA